MKEALVLVFAAASLTDALTEIGAAWEKHGRGEGSFNFASSSTLALQIRKGPRRISFSRRTKRRWTASRGRTSSCPGNRRSVLSNTLVVVVPA